ncbi:MAG: FAD-dependent oxidoreductase [Cyclobacteriaceae bacterium]|nr:FAD-dependent oxidoreductase [Cyclobacteriaceae bacterium]
MIRRKFLEQCGLLSASVFTPTIVNATQSTFCNTKTGTGLTANIVIIGGGLGGCAAALAACRQGASVIMTEPTDWIGGQVSQQAVPPDEHQWIETIGRTVSYAAYRTLIRDYYKKYYPLTNAATKTKYLNPGNGSVSRICHEPRVSVAVLQSMLAPAISNGQLRIFLNTQPTEAFADSDNISAVACLNKNTGNVVNIHGKLFIDAREEGDLLALSGTEYVIGAESQKQTGEAHAPEEADPGNIQALTHCFAIDHLEGEDHTIDRPEMYDFWKSYIPPLKPTWPGPILSLDYSYPRTLIPKTLSFVPSGKSSPAPKTETLNLWLYRRMIDRNNFIKGTYSSDITVINWPQNDFMLGNITDVSTEIRDQNLYKAKQLSLSLLYWLQTEAPRPDGKQGWKGLRLRKDIVGTEDGLAKYPYIRESRRIQAEYTITEQDITLEERQKAVGKSEKQLLAKPFNDSVGIGYNHLDLHPSTGGDNYIDMASVPFQIPLGAMIPKRMKNLIPGCKNIGTTHISNGCYRLHPVEWSIGEAAGTLCAYSLTKNTIPRKVRNSQKQLREFQSLLIKNGVELEWPKI